MTKAEIIAEIQANNSWTCGVVTDVTSKLRSDVQEDGSLNFSARAGMWTTGGAALLADAAEIDYGTPTEEWSDSETPADHLALFSVLSGGTPFWSGPLGADMAIGIGNQVKFEIGDLVVSL